MAKITRNDACPCGSGKKYKNCCGSDEKKSQKQKYTYWIVGISIVLLLAFALYQMNSNDNDAPPGKVWSEEHGHWHDI